MNLDLSLNPPSIPISGPPTPSSLFDKDSSNLLEQQIHTLHLNDTHSSSEELTATPAPENPIAVAFLPNKGRCYLATREIQPQERIFVAESFGTTMCDPWLDCGICHDCWGRIPDRKAQIRLPRKPLSSTTLTVGTKKNPRSKKTESTVMVFCNETCLNRYGPLKADLICKVEEKIRRSWDIKQAAGPNGHWRVQTTIQPSTLIAGAGAATATLNSEASAPATHYSTLIPQALAVASTPLALSKLQDQDLTLFLNCVWNALDSLVAEQESFIGTLQQQQQHERLEIASGVPDKRAEALYPMLAKFLLEGNCKATIGSKTSDDDCETIRLLTDILYRRQVELDQEVAVHDTRETAEDEQDQEHGPRGVQPTFADLCSMQSNELVLFRQQLQQDADERTGAENEADTHLKGSKQDRTGPWRELLSILPNHLLSCFYVYLRIRDAYLLLDIESAWSPAPRLSIDSALFRNILYREVANSFGIRDSSDELLAFAIFPRASYFNHSCRPNVEKRRVGRHFEYWSTTTIGENEECCISYGDINPGRIERQRRLEDMYFFRCNCLRCIEEESVDNQ
ncbi:hypothetical protein EMPS_02048 [Entomortierella parvispora]|uniref:SET domain-containing protein n=1 Tax=Entomortierella parvispora TaxID=205924 RepID=A0A9P3LTJ4_9FUNG|nr:hypothetical protein EMPS_02048 [Entomortierella parvispora]